MAKTQKAAPAQAGTPKKTLINVSVANAQKWRLAAEHAGLGLEDFLAAAVVSYLKPAPKVAPAPVVTPAPAPTPAHKHHNAFGF